MSATVPAVIEADVARALRRAGEKATAAIKVRNAAIVEAHQSGATFREIAEEVGLTHGAVWKIVRKAGGES